MKRFQFLKFIPLTAAGNTDKEGDVRNEVPEPKSSTVHSPAVQDPSVTIPTVSPKKNVSLNEVEALLHHALDAANGDEMGSAFSGNGATEAVNIYMIIVAFVVDIKFVVCLYVVFGLFGWSDVKSYSRNVCKDYLTNECTDLSSRRNTVFCNPFQNETWTYIDILRAFYLVRLQSIQK